MKPKFRAWDIHKKKMFTNDQLIIWNGNVYANDNSKLNVDNLIGYSVDEKYLMQSTGLTDKNGKEIFEGDVLKCTPTDNYYWYEKVLWDPTLAGFATQQNGYDATAISYITDNKAITVEIIGDIYQNPELVEDKQMTEKLGVLLVDVPEPKYYKYSYIELNEDRNSFCIESVDSASWVSQFGYKCTQEEAKKYPQFRWVALDEL